MDKRTPDPLHDAIANILRDVATAVIVFPALIGLMLLLAGIGGR